MTSSNATAASNPLIPLVRVPIAELRQDPNNARSHDRRNLDAIKASLQKFGQVLPVVVRAGQIVGGNATTIAADELGWTHLDVTPADHLSAEEAVALAVALNRTAELASWDASVLVDALAGLPTLEGTGFTAEELAELEQLVGGGGPGAGLTDPDDVPEPPAEPVTRPGDLWLLGPHRLLCGDARSGDDAGRLMDPYPADCMWTDPPYGVDIVGGSHALSREERLARGGLTIQGDTEGGLTELLEGAFQQATEVLLPGSAVYLAHPAGALGAVFLRAFVGAGWRHHQTLIWVKDQMVMGHADYHYQHEPILYGYTPGEGRRGRGGAGWYGDNSQVSVLFVNRPKRSEEHPTYCDVIARRWQEHTGEKPILEATGEPHDLTRIG